MQIYDFGTDIRHSALMVAILTRFKKLNLQFFVFTDMMFRTVSLLVFSNVFMTLAWYYHLKNEGWSIWKAIFVSWLIAFVEYCIAIPANRIGYQAGMNLFQLKITQEVITLLVFTVYALLFANQAFHWKYMISFLLMIGAVYFVFADMK